MQDMTETAMIPELRKVLKRLHFPLEVMLVCARWYAAYLLSFRHLEEMMQERGVFVDHSTVSGRSDMTSTKPYSIAK
jgi:transposase-like protein